MSEREITPEMVEAFDRGWRRAKDGRKPGDGPLSEVEIRVAGLRAVFDLLDRSDLVSPIVGPIMHPGDTLIIAFNEPLTSEWMARIRSEIEIRLSGVKVCILDQVSHLAVYRPDPVAEAPNPFGEKCSRCRGEGKIADSDRGEPWSTWAGLPPGSDLAVKAGLVSPIDCPVCSGTGTVQVAESRHEREFMAGALRSAARDPNCDQCNYDTHRCPGCGDDIPHGTAACRECLKAHSGEA